MRGAGAALTLRLEVKRPRAGGPVDLRLLVDGTGFGDGDGGDVVRLAGADPAHVVALGYGEPTQAKPSKTPRTIAATELVLS